MERLFKLVRYVGWPWVTLRALNEEARRKREELEKEEEERRRRQLSKSNVIEATCRLFQMIVNDLFSDNLCYNSIAVALGFNILFWGFVVFEVRGFAAASSAALVIVLCYSTLETQEEEMPNFETNYSNVLMNSVYYWTSLIQYKNIFLCVHLVNTLAIKPILPVLPHTPQQISDNAIHIMFKYYLQHINWRTKSELVEQLFKKVKTIFKSLFYMQHEQPRIFCTLVCIVLSSLWLMGYEWNIFLVAYALCLSIIFSPMFLLRYPCKELSCKEWDSEIDEFLPVVTEDNLQVLKRAGETGDRSPTPPCPAADSLHDHFNDDDLFGLRMPSHEEISVDELELSELELSSTSETDIDGIRFQTGYFERGSSSSDDDVDLDLKSKTFDEDDDSDSEFEIIDSREVISLNSV